ncbi:nuclear polyadenylated RNA-binding protein-like protein Nab2 [Plenodomus tracheiphilus IPT5]|uniref:Nuclear polyadenylated RNA-binding protein-like protein Nab2 n=1 Tax=Plenodomus tracheiphilus IPT5 TaxID=1408161 RepID=A0A6A7B518_9PLEO|nr:nuclear polyadenylated RNA-binding protein-like protein Nab2 [Plenodomus tracheiphilus IPT5]
MAVDFSNESPLAMQLQSIVPAKLAEFGWTTGSDDTTLFEYILLMLANEKNESQVAAELSNDLLDLGPENTETQQFAQWLFEQIEVLKRQLGGGGEAQVAQSVEGQMEGTNEGEANGGDMEMDGTDSQGTIPTGPKAMRNGSGAQPTRPARGGRNMLNQMNKNMNRQDDSALHRVRGAGGGIGRINSHARDPPKGPRGQNIGRGIEAMANGRGMGNANMNMGAMNNMPMGGMPGMPMPPNGQQMPGMLNPQQQMALMQMYEQQAQMMQQIFSGGTPTAFVNPNFNGNNRNGPKKPLHQRMDRPQGGRGMNPNAKSFVKKEGQDETMADGPAAENGEGMEVEHTRPEPSATMCKFNLRCTNPDCVFVHQSPAAIPGTPVDMNDTCDYGAACKNKKCVGKHPSPAQRQKFQSEQECAFWPNCRDPSTCPYKHPAKSACRNGADCTVEGCTFGHSTVMCKFNPCLNPRCPYKHAPGQKKNNTNVWVAPKEGEHVSERKFIDEAQQEELIIPGQDQTQNQGQGGEGVTAEL